MSRVSRERRQERVAWARRMVSGPKPSEVTDAEKVIAEHDRKVSEARGVLDRAADPLPAAFCPDCFDLRGVMSRLEAARHPNDPKNYDYFRCRACPYDEDEYVGG